MQRIGLLNGNNITYDKDNTADMIASIKGGVIEGLAVSGSGVSATIGIGKAFIEATRTNGEKVMVYFENTTSVTVDMSGTKKVYIALNQSKLDDGSSNAEDGTGVATITTGASYPSSNYVPLYSVTSGTITDDRDFVFLKMQNFKGMQTLVPTSSWTLLGQFKGSAGDRIQFDWIGGSGYVANTPAGTSSGKITLTIGDGSNVQNLSGYWKKDFGNAPFSIVRVARVNADPNTWNIWVYHGITDQVKNTFFIAQTSAKFMPSFTGGSAPNEDVPNGVYPIAESTASIDINGLTEDTNIDLFSDYIATFDASAGVNKKVKAVGLNLIFGDGSDGALNGNADITITGSNNTIIIKNYTSIGAGNKGSQAYTNDPSIGSNVVLNMTNTSLFAINDYVRVSSSAGGEIAKVTAVSTNVSITVDALTIDHSTTSPLVTRLTKFTITPTNCLLFIKCRGDVDLTNWYFDFQGKGGPGGNGGGAGNGAGSIGTLGNTKRNFLSNAGAGGVVTTAGSGGAVSFVHFMDNTTVLKYLSPSCGAGGGGGGGGYNGGAGSSSGGAGGGGGGAVIFAIQGNLTVSATNTVLNFKGANGTNGNGGVSNDGAGGGGGGGAGGDCMILYTGSLTGSNTPLVTGGTGGTGRGGNNASYGGGGGGGANKLTAGSNGTNGATGQYGPSGNGGAGATGTYFIGKINQL